MSEAAFSKLCDSLVTSYIPDVQTVKRQQGHVIKFDENNVVGAQEECNLYGESKFRSQGTARLKAKTEIPGIIHF